MLASIFIVSYSVQLYFNPFSFSKKITEEMDKNFLKSNCIENRHESCDNWSNTRANYSDTEVLRLTENAKHRCNGEEQECCNSRLCSLHFMTVCNMYAVILRSKI